MKLILTACILQAFFFACNEKKIESKNPVVRDTTIHNIDTVKHFFSKRYGHKIG